MILGFSQEVFWKEDWHSLSSWPRQTFTTNCARIAERRIHLDDVDIGRGLWGRLATLRYPRRHTNHLPCNGLNCR
ncbi:hypothetical protein HZ326_16909 [Fusarium oxysporum f. sp. albedinis]|nr:hypothetical protein HZ326_16909 [Fusarium oxysporum f. sp. albedinis]